MENDTLADKSQVKGLIYLIKNKLNGKGYVGQTCSHRKNKGKYKPFGIEGRLKDHISEALCNTKKKQCNRLNSAIKSYGKEAFSVELLHKCELDQLDKWEQFYIQERKTLYPEGYNLTLGGKTKRVKCDEKLSDLQPAGKRGGCKERLPQTREKISSQLKVAFSAPEVRSYLMKRSQNQHLSQKLKKFQGVNIDSSNLEQYLSVRNSKNVGQFIRLKIGEKEADFVGKHETLETLKQRALEFLKQLVDTATLSN